MSATTLIKYLNYILEILNISNFNNKAALKQYILNVFTDTDNGIDTIANAEINTAINQL